MATLSSLSSEERKHWELHLNAVMKDTPSVKKDVDVMLKGGELPKINHPAFIHDWLEQPEMRIELEGWNG